MPPTGFREIRKAFIDFFEAKGHKHLPSSSLVPKKDPTVLLTTAGMLQFKPIFMGVEKPAQGTRICTVQKCFRTTDLDNVGRTARHHTFFQMLGNFSFGDYFKADVIPWAWEFLTVNMGLPKERLWVSVFTTDDEAFKIWHEVVGVPADRIVRMGEEDNFWAAGPTGPCGPCSEIYVDMGPENGNGNPNARLGEDDDRFLEVWNLVFMEFNRDEAGVLTPLPAKNIDTGMGLERLASVLQNVKNNFETDMLRPVMDALAGLAGKPYGASEESDVSLKLMTDHLRASSFLIADGVVPSNEGRGYVLRRIIRRAYRHGRLLGIEGSFLNGLVPLVVALYGDFYTDLKDRQALVAETLLEEERRFGQTIDRGMALLEEAVARVDQHKILDGKTAFDLYDTYGFPVELTVEVAEERGIKVDLAGFETSMTEQRERAREARASQKIAFSAEAATDATSEFLGYDLLEERDTVADIMDLGKGKKGIVLNRTPFYAESGGQVGDAGLLVHNGNEIPVLDTQKRHGAIVHVVAGDAALQIGDAVEAKVDTERRWDIRRHHTATHLLHAALKQVLGTHVNQAGSVVAPDKLSFDFSLARAMTPAELARVEEIVNEQVLANTPVHTDIMGFEAARDSGAMALFDEKYGDTVRVLTIGGFSKELCGGTHVRQAGDIGLVKVTSESSVAAGVRRIEAVAGLAAYRYVRELSQAMQGITERLKASPADTPERLDRLQDGLRAAEKQVAALQSALAVAQAEKLLANVQEVNGVKFLAASPVGMGGDALRAAATHLGSSLSSGVVLMAAINQGKVAVVASVSDDLVTRGFKAGEVLGKFMALIGGKGSGKANFAQGGGGDAERVPGALAGFAEVIRELESQVTT
ncbi:MAG: alanyl-tRNA synthetase [Cyanobacteria bacterium RYN_339]|nr:alanyl-tRNA synthetase [Cyanobacteria bacterium RYN_339]